MTRLAALIISLICLAFPTGIAYGACNSNVALDQELDQGTTPALQVSVENPAECRQDARLVRTAATSTRQYDPSGGRFLSVDPIDVRNELDIEDPYVSSYVYANNRPGYYSDPSGEIIHLMAGMAARKVATGVIAAAGIAAWQVMVCGNDFYTKNEYVRMMCLWRPDKPQPAEPPKPPEPTDLTDPTVTNPTVPTGVGTTTETDTRDEEECQKKPKTGCIVYRIWGGAAAMWGRSWTPQNPATMQDPRDALGLPDTNSGRWLTAAKVISTFGITTQPAEPLDGNRGGAPEWRFRSPLSSLREVSTSPGSY